MPLTLTPSVAGALRSRDGSQLRGAAVCSPPVAPAGRASVRRAARVVCIAAGLEGASDAGDAGRDDAWEAAQRAAADIRRRNPTTDFGAPQAEAPKKGSTNAELNYRYVDGGLPRDAPLPLSLAYHFERLPQGDTARPPALNALFQPALTRVRTQTRIGTGRPCTISDSQSCSVRARCGVACRARDGGHRNRAD